MDAYIGLMIGKNHCISTGFLCNPKFLKKVIDLEKLHFHLFPVLSYHRRCYLKKKRKKKKKKKKKERRKKERLQCFKTKANWLYWLNDLQSPSFGSDSATSWMNKHQHTLLLNYNMGVLCRTGSSHKSWINSYFEFSGWWHRGLHFRF